MPGGGQWAQKGSALVMPMPQRCDIVLLLARWPLGVGRFCHRHAHAPALWLLLASGQPGPQHLDADFARILLQASGGDKAMQKVAANLQVMVAELPPLEGTTEPRNLEVWLPKRVNREWKTE